MLERVEQIQTHVLLFVAVACVLALYVARYHRSTARSVINKVILYWDNECRAYLYERPDYTGRVQKIYDDATWEFRPGSFITSPHFNAYLRYESGRREKPLLTQRRHLRTRSADDRVVGIEFYEAV